MMGVLYENIYDIIFDCRSYILKIFMYMYIILCNERVFLNIKIYFVNFILDLIYVFLFSNEYNVLNFFYMFV